MLAEAKYLVSHFSQELFNSLADLGIAIPPGEP